MCLSIKVSHPDHVLAEGEHAGHEWVVVHNGLGYRCGYVRIPKGHPWHGKDYDHIDGAQVHGGLTFAAADVPCDKGGADDAWWIGFDCAHAGDAQDPELPTESGRRLSTFDDDVIRSQEYVEAQCRSLCEQAARAARAGAGS